MLTFKNTNLVIEGESVLKNLNFKVIPGEIVVILGASGAGKSSLFSLLIGEKKPTSGEILLDDIALADISFTGVQQYRRQIGIIFQDFRLLPQKTVFENVAFALEVCGEENLIKKVVPNLLKLVGLTHRSDAFPHELSGGEKQRTSVARAMVHNPKILIADEPTGNLDPKNAREIAELFAFLNKSTAVTVLCATHDPTLVKTLNPRIIRLDKGEILFDNKKMTLDEAFKGLL